MVDNNSNQQTGVDGETHSEAFSNIITAEDQSNRGISDDNAELRVNDIRLAFIRCFIRKVYGVVTIQLLVGLILVSLATMHPGVSNWISGIPAFLYLAMMLTVVSFVPLVCCKSVRKNVIGILVCITVITLCTGTLLAVVSAVFYTSAVLLAVGTSAIIFLALSLLSFKTKLDFTRMVVGLMVEIMVFSVIVGFIVTYLPLSTNICYGVFGSFVFSTSLVCFTTRFAPRPGQIMTVNL